MYFTKDSNCCVIILIIKKLLNQILYSASSCSKVLESYNFILEQMLENYALRLATGFFLNFYLFIFIFGCVGSSFLCEGCLQLRRAGAALHRGARASYCLGLSCCGAQAPDAQAQQLWLTDLVALQRVGSSQTRARTCVPCIGRQILNHCATREARYLIL